MGRRWFIALGAFLLWSAGCRRPEGPTALGRRPERAVPAEARRLNNLGVAMLDVERTRREAIPLFQEALKRAPHFVEARINLGLALFFNQRAAEAVPVLERAVQEAPASPHAHYALAHAYRALGRTEEALEHFRQVTELAPQDAYAWYYYGISLSRAHRFQESIQALRKAVELDPVNVSALYNLAQTLGRAGQREEAARVMERFVALKEAGEGTMTTEAGLSYLEQGPYAEAIPVVLSPEEVPPRRVQARWAVAQTFAPASTEVKGEGAWAERVLRGEPVAPEELLSRRAEVVALWGQGVAWGDFDNDGDPDLYLCGPRRLLRNDGGKWTDVTSQAGLTHRDRTTAALWGDFDDDRDEDLYLLNDGPNRLYRNNGDGTFTDITQEAGVAGPPQVWSVGGAWADVDHDGDLDLYVCNYVDWGERPQAPQVRFPQDWPGAPNLLFRNRAIHPQPGTPSAGGAGQEPHLRFAPPYFVEVASAAKVDGGRAHSRAVVFSDFDVDRDIDFYLVNDGEPNALYLNRRDGTFQDLAQEAGVASPPWGERTWSVAAEDVNHDGFFDLLVVGPQGWSLFRNAQRGRFEPLAGEATDRFAWGTLVDGDNDGWFEALLVGEREVQCVAVGGEVPHQPAIHEASLPPLEGAVGVAKGDFDGDGREDLLWSRRNGSAVLWRNESETDHRWLQVRLVGRMESDKVLSNRDGIGCRVEVLGGALWYPREVRAGTGTLGCDSRILTFGLGSVAVLDFLRVHWTSGIRLAQTEAGTNRRLNLDEPPGKITSCPLLYAWDGKRFAFINDTLGGGVIGEKATPGVHIPTDPDEYLPLSQEQLAPRRGRYELRLVNQLEEVDFVDQVRLLVVDHPAQVEVFPNETLRSGPPWPEFRLFAVRGARPPERMWDEGGRDLRPLLAWQDRRFWEDFPRLRWMGLARRHILYLDLGPWPPQANLILLLHGWIDYATSSSLLAAAQAGLVPEPQRLEALQPDGTWRTVVGDIGVPAGLPRTIVVPLAGRLRPGERVLRIVSELEVFWDQVRVGEMVEAPLQVRPCPMEEAILRRLGFPQRLYPQGRPPETYDYQSVSQEAEWGFHAGAYTRFGDVKPFLEHVDDRFVIMAPGDEIALAFQALPSPEAGWRRTFLFYIFGYGKSMDVNADASWTVGPLPYRGMPDYPYPSLPKEKEEQFRRDLMEVHTRLLPLPGCPKGRREPLPNPAR